MQKRLARSSPTNALLCVLVGLSYFWCFSANPADENQSVVYARRNITPGTIISDDDLAETVIERSKIPAGVLSTKSDVVGRMSLGISCGQLIVYKQFPFGPNEGASQFGGVQPNDEITPAAFSPGEIGVMDLTGNWIIKPKYCEIHYAPKIQAFWVTDLRHNLAQEERDKLKVALGHYIYSDTWELLDRVGKKINSTLPLYTEGVCWPQKDSQNLIINANSKEGVCDEYGHEIVSQTYGSIEELEGKYFLALRESEHLARSLTGTRNNTIEPETRHKTWEILDLDGKLLTKLPNNVAWVTWAVEKGLLQCAFYSHSKNPASRFDYGLVDLSGRLVVSPGSCRMNQFSEGLACAMTAQSHPRYGFIDRSSRFVLAPVYSGAESFKNGIAFVSKPPSQARRGNFTRETKDGAIDHSGKVVLPFEYDQLMWLPNDTISALKGAQMKVLNRQLKPLFVVDKKTFINWWSDNVYQGMVRGNGHFKYLDEHGKQIGPEFDTITEFHKGHAVVGVDRRHFGLIDKKGKWILPPRYEILELCGDDRLIAKLSHQ